MSHPYQGTSAVITTQHEKEKLIAPYFASFGVEILHNHFNTDSLGTFSGEIPRLLSQRDTAIKKARIGMEATGIKYGIASEGSIGADPLLQFINSAIECIAWIDDENGIEIVEYERGTEVIAVKTEVSYLSALEDFLKRADFPNHALIAYSSGKSGAIYKGLRDMEALEKAVSEITKSGMAIVESDLRAHMSPSRREVIKRCAKKLSLRLQELCPECKTPGFGVVGNLYGLGCEQCCEEIERAVRGEVRGCAKCNHREEELNGKESASPAQCLRCNP